MGLGKDYTLYALRPGVVVFHMTKHKRDVSFVLPPEDFLIPAMHIHSMLPLWVLLRSAVRMSAESDLATGAVLVSCDRHAAFSSSQGYLISTGRINMCIN